MNFKISKIGASLRSDKKNRFSKLTQLGLVKKLTKGTPDGQWLDGNTGTNPRRWKKS